MRDPLRLREGPRPNEGRTRAPIAGAGVVGEDDAAKRSTEVALSSSRCEIGAYGSSSRLARALLKKKELGPSNACWKCWSSAPTAVGPDACRSTRGSARADGWNPAAPCSPPPHAAGAAGRTREGLLASSRAAVDNLCKHVSGEVVPSPAWLRSGRSICMASARGLPAATRSALRAVSTLAQPSRASEHAA